MLKNAWNDIGVGDAVGDGVGDGVAGVGTVIVSGSQGYVADAEETRFARSRDARRCCILLPCVPLFGNGLRNSSIPLDSIPSSYTVYSGLL